MSNWKAGRVEEEEVELLFGSTFEFEFALEFVFEFEVVEVEFEFEFKFKFEFEFEFELLVEFVGKEEESSVFEEFVGEECVVL